MSSELDAKQIIDFIQVYLTIVRRFCSVLSSTRRALFPDFWNNHYQIAVYVCDDVVAVEFKRRIYKKKDSITISRRSSLSNVYPQITGINPRFPIDGLEGIVISNLAIATESCMPFLRPGGTLLIIPDNVGLLRVTAGGDVRLQNVAFFYVDKRGVPRQFTFKCLWIIAKDSPILLNLEYTQKRALRDFLRQLLSEAPILGEKMKRYSEFDLLKEIKSIESRYINLINSENTTEQEMQKFFEMHSFVLSPFYLDICPKTITIKPQMELKRIGRKVDLILLREPNIRDFRIKCSVIELKKPQDKLFTKGRKLSHQLRLGLSQVKSVLDFVKSSPKEARKLLEIEDISNIVGIVLIGRKKDLTKEEIEELFKLNSRSASIKVLLYDDLLENIKFVSKILGKKIRQPVVIVGQKGDAGEDFTGKSGDVIQEALNYLSKRIQEGI